MFKTSWFITLKPGGSQALVELGRNSKSKITGFRPKCKILPYLLIALLYQPIASRNRPPILVILHCVSVQFQTLSIGFYFHSRNWDQNGHVTVKTAS